LGGGCFHNDILLRTLSDRLAAQGLRVLTAQRMQPNDSAISLGQAWVALQRVKKKIECVTLLPTPLASCGRNEK
jgi:hydrogenase maturation factor HypF (carbamoyltransferase family)